MIGCPNAGIEDTRFCAFHAAAVLDEQSVRQAQPFKMNIYRDAQRAGAIALRSAPPAPAGAARTETREERVANKRKARAQNDTDTLKELLERLRADKRVADKDGAPHEEWAVLFDQCEALACAIEKLETSAAQPPAEASAQEFAPYLRKQIAELRPWVAGEDMGGFSISEVDARAGSPKAGDMIARNPKNHADMWLVAAQYFADNFERIDAPASPAVAPATSIPETAPDANAKNGRCFQ
jgi:hypothetical protein